MLMEDMRLTACHPPATHQPSDSERGSVQRKKDLFFVSLVNQVELWALTFGVFRKSCVLP